MTKYKVRNEMGKEMPSAKTKNQKFFFISQAIHYEEVKKFLQNKVTWGPDICL